MPLLAFPVKMDINSRLSPGLYGKLRSCVSLRSVRGSFNLFMLNAPRESLSI